MDAMGFNNIVLFYKKFIFPVIVYGLFLVIIGCSKNDSPTNSTDSGTPAANEIFIQGSTFVTGNKTITVGTTIIWTNKDGFAHTVTSGIPNSASGLFDSGNISQNGTFSFTFTQAGEFNYFCNIHKSMTGKITVQ